MISFPDALRALASAAETAPSVRVALARWPSYVRAPEIDRAGRRARMGFPLGDALEPLAALPDGRLVARALTAHAAHGGSVARTMLALADAIEARELMAHDARVASSASKLSTRLLAGLAVTCALLLPAWHRTSPQVAVWSLGAAGALAGAGTVWMRRLMPRPPATDPPAATVADLTAALLEGGLQRGLALEVACPPDLPARRLVRLGMGWAEALARSEDAGMRALAGVVSQTSSGTGSTDALRGFAARSREEQRRASEVESRRAPVLLVLPLTTCYLPAFGLVMAGPMLPVLSGSG